MQQTQKQLIFPIDTPSDEELSHKFSVEPNRLERRAKEAEDRRARRRENRSHRRHGVRVDTRVRCF